MPRVVIIGGGPAGAALGSYLSLANIDNVIVEKANHPRPHIGESLVNASSRIFDDIGFWDVLAASGFPKKGGASWHPAGGAGQFDLDFADVPQEGVRHTHTYHVDRSKFDLLLLKHAEGLGSIVCQGVQAKQVQFADGFATGVECEIAGSPTVIEGDVVVDASGRNTLLGRQLGIKQRDPHFNQLAVHAWYEHVDRGEGSSADYIHIYMLPTSRSWVWQIPITDAITSIGAVVPGEVFKASGITAPEFLDTVLRSTPELERAMATSVRVRPVKSEGDYSYRMDHFAGNGYLLVGDAARFVDPVFSSGIGVALSSAKVASETLIQAVVSNDFSKASLASYEARVADAVQIWYEFITLYYRLAHTFTFFIQDRKHNREVLELIQGQAFSREDFPVLTKMREFVEAVENNENHILRPYLDQEVTAFFQ